MAGASTRVTGAAAILPTRDVERSLAFFEERLGFEVAFRWGDPLYYAGVCRGALTIHLNGNSPAARPPGSAAVSVFVEDADEIHREFVARAVMISVAIDDRPYGMRDFAVEDPDGNTLNFGSPTGTG